MQYLCICAQCQHHLQVHLGPGNGLASLPNMIHDQLSNWPRWEIGEGSSLKRYGGMNRKAEVEGSHSMWLQFLVLIMRTWHQENSCVSFSVASFLMASLFWVC